MRVVQGSRRERVNLADFAVKANENFAAQVDVSWTSQIMVPTVDILTGLAMAAVVLLGGRFVLHRAMDLGVMVAFIFYVQRFFDPIRTLSQQYTMLQRATAASHRILEVIDVPLQIEDAPGAEPLETADFSIQFPQRLFRLQASGQSGRWRISVLPCPRARPWRLSVPPGKGKTSMFGAFHPSFLRCRCWRSAGRG